MPWKRFDPPDRSRQRPVAIAADPTEKRLIESAGQMPCRDWEWDSEEVALFDAVHISRLPERSSVPAILERSPRLAYLRSPPYLLSLMRPHHLCNLRGRLDLYEGTADMRHLGMLPGVTELGGYHAELIFDPCDLPNVAFLTAHVAKKTASSPIAALPALKGLFMTPARDTTIRLLPRSLAMLQLMNGTLSSANPLAGMDLLEWVTFRRMTKLEDLRALADLSLLERLDLVECTALMDVGCLESCPKLEYLEIVGCKRLPKAQCEKVFSLVESRGGTARWSAA
jgi:hypothetical protein